mmetsp:Transcript_5474/g.9275  ORF Transcript_5474/g.9275 Transcript_5474/m.9275 type:complete len:90 (+) Transcript_5474:1449-1718(+)
MLTMISVGSLFIRDLRTVFGIVGLYSEAITNFILPGLFLVITQSKILSAQLNPQTTSPCAKFLYLGQGALTLVFGVAYFMVGNFLIFKK